MNAERRNQIVLGVLAVVLAGTIYRMWPADVAGTAAPRGAPVQVRPIGPAARPVSAAADLDVRVRALDDERPTPGGTPRNLFRFKPKPPPPLPPPPAQARPPLIEAGVAPGPPPPPPLPPIAFKFIGVVEAPTQTPKIAVLSDGRNVFHGREGDIIEGRFRILRIGVESIEMSYLDGRGRQTIRLTGS